MVQCETPGIRRWSVEQKETKNTVAPRIQEVKGTRPTYTAPRPLVDDRCLHIHTAPGIIMLDAMPL